MTTTEILHAATLPLRIERALRQVMRRLPKEAEPVLRSMLDAVIAEKNLRDEIRRAVDTPPKKNVGPYLKRLGQEKGRLSAVHAALLRSGANAAAKEVAERISDIQAKLDFWDTKSPEWVDMEWLLRALNDVEPKKAGPGNRTFPTYIKQRAQLAVKELVALKVKPKIKKGDAARQVIACLEPVHSFPSERQLLR